MITQQHQEMDVGEEIKVNEISEIRKKKTKRNTLWGVFRKYSDDQGGDDQNIRVW